MAQASQTDPEPSVAATPGMANAPIEPTAAKATTETALGAEGQTTLNNTPRVEAAITGATSSPCPE